MQNIITKAILLFFMSLSGLNLLGGNGTISKVPIKSIDTRNKSNKTTAYVSINQSIKIRNQSMIITSLTSDSGHAASGKGIVYVPFLRRNITVCFEEIMVNMQGELMSGKIHSITQHAVPPTYHSDETEINAYLNLARNSTEFPILLNPFLEMYGMDLGGNDMIMTNLYFDEHKSSCDAIYMVLNPTSKVTTFSKKGIPFDGSYLDFCHTIFPIDGDDQVNFDIEFPLTIKGFKPNETLPENQGSYVSFTCEGLDSFQLAAEYRFDRSKVKLNSPTGSDQVITSFSVRMKTWGQFMARVNFNGPFEIAGVDDVILTIRDAVIDYNDTTNPVSDSLNTYLNGLPSFAATKVLWRGFMIKELSIQLPSSLALGANNGRILFGAKDLIYDHANGISANVVLLPAIGHDYVASGNLSGWGVAVKSLVLKVLYNSPVKFELKGDVQIPVVKEQIGFNAQFSFANNTNGTNVPASINFLMNINAQKFTFPLLKDATMNLQNSTAGFKFLSGKFTPFANLNGNFGLDFTSGSGNNSVDGDFKFPTLGFQGFTLNYNSITNAVIPETGNTGGLGNMNFFAFNFAGITFPTGGSGQTNLTPQTDASEQPQKVKGFPVSVKNIGFKQVGNDKKLDFTIALNFTQPSVGLTASASLSITGELKVSELMTTTPWKALVFKNLGLTAITIGTQENPVNIGGVTLYGGLLSIQKDEVYGDGFKGFLSMKVEPGMKVDVVGQFGNINNSSGALDYRYWFADAKMRSKNGVQIAPAAVGVFGFGGGVYYNMEQQNFSTTPININEPGASISIPTVNNPPNLSGNLLLPGVGLSCNYKPKKNTFGVKAMVVLGTFPNPATANMDLTLTIEFNTNPFGLNTVSLSGQMFVMADIDKRTDAKIKGSTDIVFNHADKTFAIDGNVTVTVHNPVLNKNIITGGGSFNMFFNLKPGFGHDWYMAIGAPPITKRMALQLSITSTPQVMNGYFVAGRIESLPEDKRQLPRLRDYDPKLQIFEGQNNLSYNGLTDGTAILMGASYRYGVDKRFGPFGASLVFIVGFDAMLNKCSCAGYNPTGINGWYLQGQIYGALEGKITINVNLIFYKGTYNIASISAAALVQAKLPNPTWMSANVAGSYKILGGLIKGNFKLGVEFGDKCIEQSINANASELIADIKVIGAISPTNSTSNIAIYTEKVVVASFTQAIDGIMDFSAESDDGLKVMPFVRSRSLTGGHQVLSGSFRFVNGNTGLEYVSTKLLQPNTQYTFKINIGWKKWTNAIKTWVEVYHQDVNGKNTALVEETAIIIFTTGDRPATIPPEAVLSSYPDYRAINYAIKDNIYGGVALKQTGWGYLFNPKKKIKVEGKSCSEYPVFEYNYFLRIVDSKTNATVFEESLLAVPTPEWGQYVGDLVPVTEQPCTCDHAFLNWVYKIFNIPCTKYSPGPCSVLQPTNAASKSNVKNMANNWTYGGPNLNYDIPVSTNSGIVNKNIGFPDFSSSLEKGKIYSFQIVGLPIIEQSTYTVSTTQNESNQSVNSENTIILTTKTQSIQRNNVTTAPEFIIYKSEFGTSLYNTFVEKMAATSSRLTKKINWNITQNYNIAKLIPNFFNNNDWALNYLATTGLNCMNNYYCSLCKNNIPECKATFKSSNYYLPNEAYNVYNPLVNSVNTEAFQYNLVGVQEGFDVYELGRFAYFAAYDWQNGYSKYLAENASNFSPDFKYEVFPKTKVNPYNNSLFPTGPFAFVSERDNGNGILEPNQVNKTNTGTIDIMFFPRTSITYQMLRTELLTRPLPSGFYRYFKNFYELIPFNLQASLNKLKKYDEIEANYGPLFRLKYIKNGITSVIQFNAEGISSSSGNYVDYSGKDYFLKNMGSGRLASGGSAGQLLSTTNQNNSELLRFELIRNADGSYLLKCGNSLMIGFNGYDVITTTQNFPVTLETNLDGTTRIKFANGTYLYEDFMSKQLRIGKDQFHDYDVWKIEKAWSPAPPDLNGIYRFQNFSSYKYLYNGDDNAAKLLSDKMDDKKSHAQFYLRRRNGGHYDIISTNGNRIHAVLVSGKYKYSASTSSDIHKDNFSFHVTKTSDFVTFKNVKSNQFLMELTNEDIESTDDVNNLCKFYLRHKDYYHAYPDYSGTYYLKIAASGADIVLSDNILVNDFLTTTTSNNAKTNKSKYKLIKLGSTPYYRIQYLTPPSTVSSFFGIPQSPQYVYQTSDGKFNIGSATDDYSKFLLTPVSDKQFRFICFATNDLLAQKFDINLGVNHNKILATKESDDYAIVIRESSYTPVHQNLSGRYLIKSKNTGHYVHTEDVANGGLVSARQDVYSNNLNYILKRKANAKYEIWSSAANKRWYTSPDGNCYVNAFNEVSEFDIQNTSGGYNISSDLKYLAETSNRDIKANQTITNAGVFILTKDFVLKNMEVYITNHGSGKNLEYAINQANVSMKSTTASSANILFRLEYLEGKIYKIISMSNNKYLHYADNGNFNSIEVNGLPENHYRFELNPISGLTFTIKSLADNRYLKESYDNFFDYSNSKLITDTYIEADYSYFNIRPDYQPSPANLSGIYYIQSAGSGRPVQNGPRLNIVTPITSLTSLFGNNNSITENNKNYKFLIKRRSTGKYEIISANGLKRVFELPGGFFSSQNDQNQSPEYYQFDIDTHQNGFYTIKNWATNNYLYNYFDVNLGSDHNFIKGSNTVFETDSYFKFNKTVGNVSTEYEHLFNKKVRIVETANDLPLVIQSDESAIFQTGSGSFVLKPKNSGFQFEIWSTVTGRRLHYHKSYTGVKSSTVLVPGLDVSQYQFRLQSSWLFDIGRQQPLYTQIKIVPY
ncbi:MAG: hypothetical protein H7X99_02300 [Saprospiraceae bacterium]|nr:hypothetical protein [Saprospiraceae bacterium]